MPFRVMNPRTDAATVRSKPAITLVEDYELQQEIQDRKAADIQVLADAKLYTDDETTRAKAAEDGLQKQISGTSLTKPDGTNDDSLVQRIANVASALVKETQDRTSADTALGGRIDDEAQTRANADTALGGRIDTEIQDRTTADAKLQAQISGTSLVAPDGSDDDSLVNRIAQETIRAQQAEQLLHQELTTEIDRANGEEKRIDEASIQRDADEEQERQRQDAALLAMIRGTTLPAPNGTDTDSLVNRLKVEEAARIAKDKDLDDRLTPHLADMNNPHHTSLQQAANQQGSTPTSIGSGIYEGSTAEPGLKYQTKNEVVELVGTPVRYKGQLRWGAQTLAYRDTIPANSLGQDDLDFCFVQETQTIYKWNTSTSTWDAQPQPSDRVIGDMYEVLFWYGVWTDNTGTNSYHGEVSAQMVCKTANPNIFEVTVITHPLQPGAATDTVIGNRQLNDNAENGTLIGLGPSFLGKWLQDIRDNLKWLFNHKVTDSTYATDKQAQAQLDAGQTQAINANAAAIAALKPNGNYQGTYNTVSALPSNVPADATTFWKVGDWALVSLGPNNMPAIYRVQAISDTHVITWVLDYGWSATMNPIVTSLTLSSNNITSGTLQIEQMGKQITLRFIDVIFRTFSDGPQGYSAPVLPAGAIPAELRPPYACGAALVNYRIADNWFPWPCFIVVLTDGSVNLGYESSDGRSTRRWCGVVTWNLP